MSHSARSLPSANPLPEADEGCNARALTIKAAALRAGVADRTIRRWIDDGRLPSWKVDGRIYVHEGDVNVVEAATRRHGGRRRKWQMQRAMS